MASAEETGDGLVEILYNPYQGLKQLNFRFLLYISVLKSSVIQSAQADFVCVAAISIASSCCVETLHATSLQP
ncbi:hypothetical protein [Coleofasciculus sp. B1-GNL1-01]|uniref:hypothetical protein n=1 Tax=Coleofasciculus sp. B1-GNL1-01 TaxID=3068484 RepID=UPI004064B9AB